MGTYAIRLNVRMNGVRETILSNSDQVLGEVLAANNIPYEGVNLSCSGKRLTAEDFGRTMGELGFPEEATLMSIKNLDCA